MKIKVKEDGMNMEDIDSKILECIKDKYKSARVISEELSLPYVRVHVRLKHLRRRKEVRDRKSVV